MINRGDSMKRKVVFFVIGFIIGMGIIMFLENAYIYYHKVIEPIFSKSVFDRYN